MLQKCIYFEIYGIYFYEFKQERIDKVVLIIIKFGAFVHGQSEQ